MTSWKIPKDSRKTAIQFIYDPTTDEQGVYINGLFAGSSKDIKFFYNILGVLIRIGMLYNTAYATASVGVEDGWPLYVGDLKDLKFKMLQT